MAGYYASITDTLRWRYLHMPHLLCSLHIAGHIHDAPCSLCPTPFTPLAYYTDVQHAAYLLCSMSVKLHAHYSPARMPHARYVLCLLPMPIILMPSCLLFPMLLIPYAHYTQCLLCSMPMFSPLLCPQAHYVPCQLGPISVALHAHYALCCMPVMLYAPYP